ncbi:hypothetical protein BJY04DRAFT_192793 [Aspergillus karnatakaensis]|uniref:uncharacterized protein n=1 Tax=Aspergillus karnatakaensis TaxID=1810916 RepID=UPI003CCDAB22
MSDPLSISGGVVGIVSLGLAACQGLMNYYGPWKSYDEEINDFTARAKGLEDTLLALAQFLSSRNDVSSKSYRKLVEQQLTPCEAAFHRLDAVLEKCRSHNPIHLGRRHDWPRLRRAVYPFRRDTLVSLSETISGLQATLQLSLQLLNSAVLSHQQEMLEAVLLTTTSISAQTSKFTNVVNPNNAIPFGRPAQLAPQPVYNRVLDPQTLKTLCTRQKLIRTAWRTGQSSQVAPSASSKHCTCHNRSFSASTFSFSFSGTYETNCPLHSEERQMIALSAKYAFCNRVIRLSVNAMMTLTWGAGAFSISPTLRFHSVVRDDSPAFNLLNQAGDTDFLLTSDMLEDIRQTLLQMFQDQRATPTDRLADGSTLLHRVAYMLNDASCFGPEGSSTFERLRELVLALIDAGVPVNEKTSSGETALDSLIWYTSLYTGPYEGVRPAVIDMLQRFLVAGSTLGPLVRSTHHDEVTDSLYPLYMYQIAQAAQALVNNHGHEDIQLSAIEMAILTRSDEDLRECLTPGRHSKNAHGTGRYFRGLFAQCLGWPHGMTLLMESSLPRDDSVVIDCFSLACDAREFESALLLLKYTPDTPLDLLSTAVDSGNVDLCQTIIDLLAAQRNDLQALALQHLPQRIISHTGLSTSSLPDTNAFTIHKSLINHGVRVPFGLTGTERSIYSATAANMAVSELLYNAGFTGLTQCGSSGNVPIVDLAWDACAWSSVTRTAELIHWMVGKGADLYQPSVRGYPAIYPIAEAFGPHLKRWDALNWDPTFMYRYHRQADGTQTRELCHSRHVSERNVAKVLTMLLTDNTQDDCVCACSQADGRCRPLTRLLKSSYCCSKPFTDSNPAQIATSQDFIYDLAGTDRDRRTISASLRFFTFEKLGLTHTCHGGAILPGSEEVWEVREEESALIDLLEELVMEFEEKFDEFDVPLSEFIDDYWELRMDEVLQERDVDLEDVRRAQEIGVVLEGAKEEDWRMKKLFESSVPVR